MTIVFSFFFCFFFSVLVFTDKNKLIILSSNLQAANVGFCRVVRLVSGITIFILFAGACGISLMLLTFLGLFYFQAKPDAGKLVIATIALLIASTTSILIVGIPLCSSICSSMAQCHFMA